MLTDPSYTACRGSRPTSCACLWKLTQLGGRPYSPLVTADSEGYWLALANPEGGGTHMRIERRPAGRWVVTGVYIHAPEVTAGVLQRIQVGDFDLAANLDLEWKLSHGGSFRALGDHRLFPAENDNDLTLGEMEARERSAKSELRIPEPPPVKRPKLSRPDGTDPDGFYAQVAQAYREYAPRTRATAVAIAEEAGVPVGTVHGWIREARRRGHLPAGRKGSAG